MWCRDVETSESVIDEALGSFNLGTSKGTQGTWALLSTQKPGCEQEPQVRGPWWSLVFPKLPAHKWQGGTVPSLGNEVDLPRGILDPGRGLGDLQQMLERASGKIFLCNIIIWNVNERGREGEGRGGGGQMEEKGGKERMKEGGRGGERRSGRKKRGKKEKEDRREKKKGERN